MNLPAQLPQLPPHLMALQSNTALMAMNTAASAGISAGGWPRISIKGSRFRLQSPQGEEVVAGIELDVIVVDANPHGLSKVFYAGAYDPSVEEKAPDCWSDNGVGPSSKAAKPQCGTCAACPNNVWGSKINPSGSQTKACADVKKVAVLIAANPEGPVFELRIPPASLKNFATYIEAMNSRGIPAAAVVTKLKFDANADYPKMMFESSGWATAEQAKVVLEVIGTEEVDQCTGKNDRPIAANAQLAAPTNTAPSRQVQHVATAPVAAQAVPANAPVLPPTMQPAPTKRTRRTKAELAEAAPVQTEAALPPFLQGQATPPAQNAAHATTPLTPAGVTNAALDAMIQGIMNV